MRSLFFSFTLATNKCTSQPHKVRNVARKRDTEQKAIVALSGPPAWNANPLEREGKAFRHTNPGNRFKSARVSSKIPPKTFAWNIQPGSLCSTFFTNEEEKTNEGKIKRAPRTLVVGSKEGKTKVEERKRERSIVVKLRRKHRSRRNNTMFYARRLTFYSETALLETTMLQIKKIVIFRCKRKGKCFCV